MIFISHLILALAGALLSALGISLFQTAFLRADSDYSIRRTRTLGMVLLLISVLASVIACTSLWIEEVIYSLPLTIGSIVLWSLGVLSGNRFIKSESSVKHLALATTTLVILWWVMRNGQFTADECFLLVGLGVWMAVFLCCELKEIRRKW